MSETSTQYTFEYKFPIRALYVLAGTDTVVGVAQINALPQRDLHLWTVIKNIPYKMNGRMVYNPEFQTIVIEVAQASGEDFYGTGGRLLTIAGVDPAKRS